MSALDPAALLAEITAELTPIFAVMEWAEDEIERAQERHPEAANRIYHSFKLLRDETGRLTRTERGYRSHCAELLDRVAASEDTRPGTAAEVCLVCCDSSLSAPLTEAAAGLYARMFQRAFPQDSEVIWRGQSVHYEGLHAVDIDHLEAKTRKLCAQPWRRLVDVECSGQHHGEPAPDCPLYREPKQGSLGLEAS